ncbi:MAG: hypothetical protein KDD22_00915, partial [Bdellovibrionales bacterium]|nr:hypothetical protein [Bdellovibrionales bacterium]
MSSLSSQIDFWHFEGDQMVFKDGSFGAGFKITGFDLTCAHEPAINALTQGLESLLTSCEEGFKVQVFYKLSPLVEDIVKGHESLSSPLAGNYKRIVDARARFFKMNQANGHYFVPSIYLFVRSKKSNLKKQGIFSSDESFKTLSEKEFRESKEKFERT